jgi:DNA-binding MarR family transcriptional regulator/AcrR family transcriptional regulator
VPPRSPGGAADPRRIELQRARKLLTAAEAVRRFPFEGFSASLLNGRAGVSLKAFEEHLDGREAALLAAFQKVLALAGERASAAFQAQEGWVERIRAGLLALLEFFDEEPALARFCVVHSAQAGPAMLAARCEVLDALARVLDDERAPARGYPPPLTAEAVVSGVLGVLHGRLRKRDAGVLAELCNPLMSFIVLPFLGVRAARRELSRPLDATSVPVGRGAALDLLQDAGGRLNRRTVSVLRVIGGEPGLNNREVALRAGVKDQGQISRLLSRLARLGLVAGTRDARSRGAVKAWRLTARGRELERAVRHEALAPEPSVGFDLPQVPGGRLDYRAVLVLRVIGEQPWLSNRELALRAGVKDGAQVSRLLGRLTELGLVAGTRDARRRGAPNAWQLTASGVELDRAMARETPAPRRSVALDLMRDAGGRLNHRSVSVLRVIGGDPGLSNSEVALRVGVAGKSHISRLLARLARLGLVENIRCGGRENVWQLTTSGKQLERAIRHDTPGAGG